MVLLYENALSSYVQKVKIMLREKGVAFIREAPDSFGMGPCDDAFWRASPRGEVPALVDTDAEGRDVVLFESTVICEYVEERWPEPALLPRDPAARARARLIEEVCDSQYEAINWGWGEILWFRRATGVLAERMQATARRQTAVMQGWLEERLGGADWFGGAAFGWADAAAAPMVNRSVHYGLGPAAGSALAGWHARLRERASVAETFAEFDGAALLMARAAERYSTGGRRREYRDHRLDWMVRSGGMEVVLAGMRDGNIRFSWPAGET